MLSTEVQRTLVKSPPELWAELSDSESLARHLGALGEIRITRIEPEREVHWETERASGTVLIKPTGWGTKVELSVSHEPAPAAGTAAHAHAPAVETEPGADDGAAPSPLQDRSQPLLESPPVATPEHAPAPSATPPAPPVPAPAAPASKPPASAPPALTHAGKSSPRPLEPIPQAIAEGAPEAVSEPIRRGRLARLFGAFKRSGREPPAHEARTAQAPAPHSTDSLHPLDAALPPDDRADPPLSAIEALQARFETPREAPSELPTPLAPSHQVAEGVPQTASPSTIIEASPAAPAPPPEERQPQTAQGAPAPDASASAPAPPAADEAAEDAAAEEVEALLTAMLDRLGAAHHRPFSRA